MTEFHVTSGSATTSVKQHSRVRRLASGVLVAALAVVSLTTSSGCIVIAGNSANNWNDDLARETRVATVDHVPGKPLTIRSHNGSVTVHKGGTDKVQITANIRARTKERLEKVEVRSERTTDGTLLIEPRFPENRPKGSEGCSFDIVIPDVQSVAVSTSNGSVEVEGLSGRAVLESSNGGMALTSHEGQAQLNTSNGQIKIRGVKGDINADSSNGGISIVGATGKVIAETSNAAIECEMAPDAPGPVTLETSNGAIVLGVGPAFAGELFADTSNAAISLTNLSADSNVTKSRASLKFKTPGGKSVVETSNGAIKIRGQNAG